MRIYDKFTVALPLDLPDRFGNRIESWLHWEGVGKHYIISKDGNVFTRKTPLKISEIGINILKSLSYVILLPLTLGCLIYREVRRRYCLSQIIPKVFLNNIDPHPAAPVEKRPLKKRPPYPLKDYCLVRVEHERSWIRSHEDQKRFLKALSHNLAQQKKPIQIHFILGEANLLSKKINEKFEGFHPLGVNGRPKTRVWIIRRAYAST